MIEAVDNVIEPSQRHALEMLAGSPHGCTESIMMAHGCAIGVLRDLVRDGLATAASETTVAGRRRINWGYYCDPEMDKLLGDIRNAFDPAEQTKLLQKVHEKYVDDALFLMVAHDVIRDVLVVQAVPKACNATTVY
jgi:ABC-type transport system substrate-binding protein